MNCRQMEITRRYTLENWRTQEIEIRDIPEPVLDLQFEEVLAQVFGEIGSLDLNPVELTFSCIFLECGWRVVRTPLSENNPAQKHIAVAIEQASGVSDGLFGLGVPDLFLWQPDG